MAAWLLFEPGLQLQNMLNRRQLAPTRQLRPGTTNIVLDSGGAQGSRGPWGATGPRGRHHSEKKNLQFPEIQEANFYRLPSRCVPLRQHLNPHLPYILKATEPVFCNGSGHIYKACVLLGVGVGWGGVPTTTSLPSTTSPTPHILKIQCCQR